MAEYIDRNALMADLNRFAPGGYSEKTALIIGKQPAADVAPVVRCRECKHQKKVWHNDKRMKEGGYWIFGCERNQDPFVSHTVDGYDDDFCSHGERKEEQDG